MPYVEPTFSKPIDFTFYCPKCGAWEHGDHAAERHGNATSLSWLWRHWLCFCPTWEPRKYA